MKRRDFLTKAGASGLIATGALGISRGASASTKHKWKMVTTWPKNFPGLGTGANTVARLITEMSGGRIEVKVYGAKQLVGPFEKPTHALKRRGVRYVELRSIDVNAFDPLGINEDFHCKAGDPPFI